jgi:mannose-1-phosphate guanylyltransferase
VWRRIVLKLDYGWITPGEKLDGSPKYRIHAVGSFVDKPTVAQADAALAGGALWNTCVAAAKAETLWQLGWQCFPDLMERFERLDAAIGTPQEVQILDELYQDMPAHHFFPALLRRAPDRTAVIEVSGVLWSDWGKPEQIAHTLRRIGRQPAFPLDCLCRPFAPIPQAIYGDGVPANLSCER